MAHCLCLVTRNVEPESPYIRVPASHKGHDLGLPPSPSCALDIMQHKATCNQLGWYPPSLSSSFPKPLESADYQTPYITKQFYMKSCKRLYPCACISVHESA